MTYRFKPWQELAWGVVIAVSLVVLQALFVLEPEQVTDWQVWAVAIGGAAIRAGAGAALDYLRRSMSGEPDLPAAPPMVDTALVTALADELERRQAQRVQRAREIIARKQQGAAV